jgi:hypothetical protein
MRKNSRAGGPVQSGLFNRSRGVFLHNNNLVMFNNATERFSSKIPLRLM